MATLKSHNTQETLHFNIAGLTYFHYSGGYHLEIDCALSTPEHTIDIGTVYTGPDFAEELREFDFTDLAFYYAYNFEWENDDSNADWWIEREPEHRTVNLEFTFERRFNLMDGDREDREFAAEETVAYLEPLITAQTDCPGLKIALGADSLRRSKTAKTLESARITALRAAKRP